MKETKIAKPKKAEIELKPYYYSEDELDLIVPLDNRDEGIRVSVKTIKTTIEILKQKKQTLEKELEDLQQEININQNWLENIKTDLLKIKYFEFEK